MRSLPGFIFFLSLIIPVFPFSNLRAADNRVLTITHASDYAPMVFIDRDGKPAGFLVDIWKMWGERNGITVRFLLTDWRDTINLVLSGQADIHGGLFIASEREQVIDFVLPIVKMDGIVYADQSITARNLDELGNIPVGYIEGDFSGSFLSRKHPGVRKKSFTNYMALIDALIQGRIQVLISDEPQMIFYQYRENIPGSLHEIETLYTRSLFAAVRKGNRETAELVRKGFGKIGQQEITSVQETWMPYREKADWFTILRITGGILAVVLILVMAGNHYYLRRQVREKTAALQDELSNRRKFEKQLLEMATHDSLTGLPNRKFFGERVAHGLASARRFRTHVAILFLDLDGFKAVNDTMGHDSGDELLRLVAQRLLKCVRETDTVARLGGDEFTILLENVRDIDEVHTVARRIIDSIAEVYPLNSGDASVTVSAGVSLYPSHGEEYDILLRRADAAMYMAKMEGKNSYRFYRDSVEREKEG